MFARLRYDSGDWDYNPKVAANVLNSIVEYTNIAVYPEEVVITADSEELLAFPFLFMTGHKLVRFSDRERERAARRSSNAAASCFRTTAITTSPASMPPRSSRKCIAPFLVRGTLDKLPRTHAIYRSFFQFPDGRRKPPTS